MQYAITTMSEIRFLPQSLHSNVAVTPNVITCFGLTVLTGVCATDVEVIIRTSCMTTAAST